MINVTIDNKQIQVEPGTTILKAARQAGIDIPTLCYFELAGMKFENKPGGCRVCVVEVVKDFNGKPRRNLAPACATDCVEGMEVLTHSPRVINARKTVVELILSDHPNDCLQCERVATANFRLWLRSSASATFLSRANSQPIARTRLCQSSAMSISASCAVVAKRCATPSRALALCQPSTVASRPS